MPVSKTKAKLVDVARQLFAKMGVENTTMNDIALASKKGRRTLYTYFKSKEDIYLAVVESQLDILLDTMKRVADKCISPDEKMLEMIYTRLDVVKEVVYRNGTLRADFFRDIWKERYAPCRLLPRHLEGGEGTQAVRRKRGAALQGRAARGYGDGGFSDRRP